MFAAAIALVVGSVGTIWGAPQSAMALLLADYPSWQDVQEAQASEAATQALVIQIQAQIAGLQSEVERTQAIAEEKGAALGVAQLAVDEQAFVTEQLQNQATAAQLEADESLTQAGQLLAELSMSGGGDFTTTLLTSASSADTLLNGLGTMTKLTETFDQVYAQALQQKNTAESLAEQAGVAEAQLEVLRQAAQAAFDEAQAAAIEAQTALAAQQEYQAQLEAQLVVLTEQRQATEADYLAGVRERWGANANGQISETGWGRPAVGYITSGYGPRTAPTAGASTFHAGTDLAGPGYCGTTLWAAHGGTVTYAGYNGGLGYYVQIDHGNGVSTGYGHIQAGGIHVSIGERVDVGQPIALAGTTGTSTGCHLHFIVRVNGSAVDPVPFMRNQGITLGG